MLPLPILNLAEKFRLFPGLGVRSSQKLSLDVLQLSKVEFDDFVKSLEVTRSSVKFCTNCGFFAELDNADSTEINCEICKNHKRKINQLCLLEKATDVITLERSQIYFGRYHVLQKLISPLENIFPEDTTLNDLLDRRIPHILQTEDTVEIILFFKAGFEAEATTAYLQESIKAKKLSDKVQVTRLAQGLPLYYNPDTLDQATMAKALEDRRLI
jgi:recombination protein RecR